jgi:hypothetical protein
LPRKQRQRFKVELAFWFLGDDVARARVLEGAGCPLGAVVVAVNGGDSILLAKFSVGLHHLDGVERRARAAHHISDEAAGVLLLVPDAHGECVVTAAAWVGEREIANALTRRQLEGSAVVDGGLDQLVVEEGGEV